jgi:hypothetical protein
MTPRFCWGGPTRPTLYNTVDVDWFLWGPLGSRPPQPRPRGAPPGGPPGGLKNGSKTRDQIFDSHLLKFRSSGIFWIGIFEILGIEFLIFWDGFLGWVFSIDSFLFSKIISMFVEGIFSCRSSLYNRSLSPGLFVSWLVISEKRPTVKTTGATINHRNYPMKHNPAYILFVLHSKIRQQS